MTKEDEKVVEGCEKWSQLAAWSHVSISAQIAAASLNIRYDDDCHDYEDDDEEDDERSHGSLKIPSKCEMPSS